jgi:hypothetical protein
MLTEMRKPRRPMSVEGTMIAHARSVFFYESVMSKAREAII